MSQTISVGVVGPSHWAYMASVMAEKLEQIKNARRTDAARFPKGVYHDALEFYKLVLEAAGDGSPKNPPASINAYAIAADAVRAVCTNVDSRSDVAKTLHTHQSLLESLQQARILEQQEVETLSSLQSFFVWLKHEGEADAYERGVGYELPVGLRQH